MMYFVWGMQCAGADIAPAGWNVRFYNTTTKSGESVNDPIYVSPEGKLFRSRIAVIRHQLDISDKDAIKSFRQRLKAL
jgi:hypothetical protein